MAVFRLLLNQEPCDGYDKEDMFEFCKDKHIAGVGFMYMNKDNAFSDDYKAVARKLYKDNSRACITAMNIMKEIKVGDFIWYYNKVDSKYYVCKVIRNYKDSMEMDASLDRKDYEGYDITNYVHVEWLNRPFSRIEAPGNIVRGARGGSIKHVYDIDEITGYLWNKYSSDKVEIGSIGEDLFSFLGYREIEELFILYLQAELGYYVYTDTVKASERLFECTLVDNEGNKAYPQVKSGNTSIYVENYLSVLDEDENAKIYLFAANQDYVFDNVDMDKYKDRIIDVDREDLEYFIDVYGVILPPYISSKIELFRSVHSSEK